MQKAKKVLFYIISIVLGLVLILNAYSFVSIKILKQPLAPVFGYATLEVISGSMDPVIKKGDIIMINTNYDELYKYDIVTYYDDNKSFVTHRILDIKDDKLLMQGDANNTDDGYIDASDVVGKYVKKYNGAGFLLNSLKNPFAIAMIFVIGILGCVFLSLDKNGEVLRDQDELEMEAFRKYKKEKDEKVKRESESKSTVSKESNKKENSSGSKSKTSTTKTSGSNKKVNGSGSKSKTNTTKTNGSKKETKNSTQKKK